MNPAPSKYSIRCGEIYYMLVNKRKVRDEYAFCTR